MTSADFFRAFQTALRAEVRAPTSRNTGDRRLAPEGRSGSRKKWLGASRFRTLSLYTPTRNPPFAIFAASFWKVSSSRASSARTVGSTSIGNARITSPTIAPARRPKNPAVSILSLFSFAIIAAMNFVYLFFSWGGGVILSLLRVCFFSSLSSFCELSVLFSVFWLRLYHDP